MTKKELKAVLTLDESDYTAGMKKAANANDDFGDSSEAVHDKTLANVEAFREAKDMMGDMDSSVRGVTGALDHFGWTSEDTTHDLNNMGETAALTEAFIRPFVQMVIIATARTWQMAAAIGAVSTGAMAMGAMISLAGAKTDKQKAAWLAMTSILWGLTAAQTAFAIAKSGMMAPATAALIGASIAGAIAVIGGLAIASQKKTKAQSTHRTPTVIEGHSGEAMSVVATRAGGGTPRGGGGKTEVIVLARSAPQVARYLRKVGVHNEYRSGLH